jgi:alkanesulfonate monooxygenase SsuD/methylene tetrahydromethanopterin reductase-like flavin-dependent oxidoreductase (luciferase family)
MGDLKLGLQLGYWGAGPNPKMVEIAQEAEKLGYDALFTAEAWGSDVFTPLAWIGAHTERIRLGTGIAQMSARAPTATAMAALTLDQVRKSLKDGMGRLLENPYHGQGNM